MGRVQACISIKTRANGYYKSAITRGNGGATAEFHIAPSVMVGITLLQLVVTGIWIVCTRRPLQVIDLFRVSPLLVPNELPNESSTPSRRYTVGLAEGLPEVPNYSVSAVVRILANLTELTN